jgi:hypothetical protein
MTPRHIAAVAVAASLSILVLVIGTGLGWWGSRASPPASARPIAVRTSLQPANASFGDELVAEVDVDVDTAAISPSRLHVVPSFAPYAQTGAPVVSQSRSGRFATVSLRYRIQCVSEECLPAAKPLALRLPPVVVSALDGGRTRQVTAAWPPALVASRLSSNDLQRVRFRRSATLLQPTYATSPNVSADLLTAVAGGLALLAVAVLTLEAVRFAGRRRSRIELTPLEEALRLTRESARRSNAADRRKALSLLSQTLEDDRVSKLAAAAGDAAWSESPPSPDAALRLAEEVETAGSTRR